MFTGAFLADETVVLVKAAWRSQAPYAVRDACMLIVSLLLNLNAFQVVPLMDEALW